MLQHIHFTYEVEQADVNDMLSQDYCCSMLVGKQRLWLEETLG